MSRPRRSRLQIDDPLGPTQPTSGQKPIIPAPATPKSTEPAPVQAGSEGLQPGRTAESDSRPPQASHQEEADASRPEASDQGVWRTWSGITGVGSFRLPHELLVELSDTARQLALPIGMVVAAAITQMLDQPPEHIAQLVDRADDARIHGRRTARRRLIEPNEP